MGGQHCRACLGHRLRAAVVTISERDRARERAEAASIAATCAMLAVLGFIGAVAALL
jgi:hypothetical protein